MKILHVDTAKSWRGGQQQVFFLHGALHKLGFDTLLMARKGGDLYKRAESAGLPVHPLKSGKFWNPCDLFAVKRHGGGRAILHAHDAHAAGLIAVAKSAGDIFVCHRRVSYPVSGLPFSRLKYSRVDRWIAVSEEVGGVLRGCGYPASKISVVHSSLDINSFRAEAAGADIPSLRYEFDLEPGGEVVGMAGAFSAQKGYEVLVRAAPLVLKERPKALFLLVGKGDLQAKIRDMAASLGVIKSFRFAGFRKDVARVSRLFDVAVVPSVGGEGSSASIKEPMALGIPAVVSSLPGNVEVIGGAGEVFENGSHEGLAAGIIKLLSDAAIREKCSAEGMSRVELFSVDNMVEKTIRIYRELSGGE